MSWYTLGMAGLGLGGGAAVSFSLLAFFNVGDQLLKEINLHHAANYFL